MRQGRGERGARDNAEERFGCVVREQGSGRSAPKRNLLALAPWKFFEK